MFAHVQMGVADYLTTIGPAYLTIPIIAGGFGWVAHSATQAIFQGAVGEDLLAGGRKPT